MSDVPSNLIPFRVTDLPIAPSGDASGILLYVLGGRSYQVAAVDLLQVSGVPTTRQVIAGTGLSGGGQLSSNVTLNIAPGGISDTELSSTGVTSGTYGSVTEVPVIQINSKGRITSVSNTAINLTGKVNTTTQVIAGVGLSGGGALASNVTLNADVSDLIPLSVNTTGVAGTSQELSRADHRHPAVNLSSDDEVDGTLGLGNGGLGNSLVPVEGALLWCGTSEFFVGPPGLNGQVLISGGPGAYTWGSALVESDQPANFVYSGPPSGPDAGSAFRLLVNSDIPTALSGKTIENSPVGATTASTVRGTTITATSQFSGPGTGLTGTASGLSIGGVAATATLSTKSTNLAGGAASQIPYQTDLDATGFIPNGSSGQVLTSQGVGTPTWAGLDGGTF